MADLKQIRTIPNFDAKLAYGEIKSGVVAIIIFVCIILLIFRMLFVGGPKTGIFAWYIWILPFLYLISIPLLSIFIGIQSVIEGVSLFINKNKWIKSAASTQATIVIKRIGHDYIFREVSSHEVYMPELKLKYTPTLATTNSSEQTIWAYVDMRIYEKYEPRDTVLIYYSVTDPSVFFIEGE